MPKTTTRTIKTVYTLFFLTLCGGIYFFLCIFPNGGLLAKLNPPKIRDDLQFTSIENGAVFPANFVAPLFEITPPKDIITAKFFLHAENAGDIADIPLPSFSMRINASDIFKRPVLGDVTFSLLAKTENTTYRGLDIHVKVIEAELQDNIIYRLVGDFFNVPEESQVEILHPANTKIERVVTTKVACMSCHTHSDNIHLWNARNLKSRNLIAVAVEKEVTKRLTRELPDFSFLSLSPSGMNVALVSNAKGNLVPSKDPIDPFVLRYQSGDLSILDIKSGEIKTLPGASDPLMNEDMPNWSPDGNTIIFSRYDTTNSMALYEIPFNNGNGGVARILPHTEKPGEQNYFARYSPNGKWISYCKAQSGKGVFARPSSDIYLYDKAKQQEIKLNINKDNVMDSWHSWSTNSHWLLFASKRDLQRKTGAYISYIDDDGNTYPPFKILGNLDRKINTPEFVRTSDLINFAGEISDQLAKVPQ